MRWKYPFLTACFLVLLRLAIGWHFLYEGYHKVHSLSVGLKPFSSASFFREAHGPLGDYMRHALGDPDENLLARLTLLPAEGPQKKGAEKAARLPQAVRHDWDAYFKRFESHYGLDDKQRTEAQGKLQKAEAGYVDWLTAGKKAVTKTYPSGSVELTETTERRVEEYRDALQHVRDTYTKELPAFGRDVEKDRLRNSIADVAALRKSLETDVNDQTEAMKKSLA